MTSRPPGFKGRCASDDPSATPTAQIYLDYNASTPIDPRVADVMRPLLTEAFGNPSSDHWAGRPAARVLQRARCQVADLLGAAPDEIIFTSGATEANNLALKGHHFNNGGRNHIITQVTEHPAVLEPLVFLKSQGAEVTYVPVDGHGQVDPDAVRRAITPRTGLITIMHANNETGTVQPIEDIGSIAREHGVWFHTDAAQSVGKIDTHVDVLGVDMLAIAGHKLYAPKGIGVLYLRRGVTVEPLIHGAGHESGRRAGTESALLAAALGEACVLADDLTAMERVRPLRDRLWRALQDRFTDRVLLNGHRDHRLPNTLNVSFVDQVGAEVLGTLPGVAASTGSACHSSGVTPSPVLVAMGVPEKAAMGAIRFSLGRETSDNDIDTLIALLIESPVLAS